MAAPIEQRIEKLLDLAERRGMVVESLRVEGQRIEITYATAGTKGQDADLIDFRRPRR